MSYYSSPNRPRQELVLRSEMLLEQVTNVEVNLELDNG